jgi:hypothetical protein
MAGVQLQTAALCQESNAGDQRAAGEVRKLHSRGTASKLFVIQRTRENEKKVIMLYEERIATMRAAFAREVEKRKEYFLALDATLSDQLPFLQAEVEGRMQSSG